MHVRDRQFLIIGGVPKAGTTSLFQWLAKHPDISPSIIKETRFFLDAHNPLPSPRRYDGSNLSAYLENFVLDDRPQILLEATPDYFFSETALTIAEELPKAKMVFVLRDQVDRMVSWYKYSIQRGFIERGCDFEGFLRLQVPEDELDSTTPVHLQALAQGQYERHLNRFREAFGERMLILDFEGLRRDPLAALRRICEFVGVSAEYYSDGELQAANVSHALAYPKLGRAYGYVRRWLAERLMRYPRVRALMAKLNKSAKRLVFKPATDSVVEVEVPERVRRWILDRTSGGPWAQ